MSTAPAMQSKPRRFRTYSLRGLMMVVCLLCVGLAWFSWKLSAARRQRDAVEALEKSGAVIAYEIAASEYGKRSSWPRAHAWLGQDFFYSVERIHGFGSKRPTDATLAPVAQLAGLKDFRVTDPQITDAGVIHLAGLRELTDLDLSSTSVTDDGLAQLKGLERLRVLALYDTKVTDAGMQHLRHWPHLRYLDLRQTAVTNDALMHVGKLPELQNLVLSGLPIDDVGLAHLKKMTSLTHLYVAHTEVTDNGMNALAELPNLEHLSISFMPKLEKLAPLSSLKSIDFQCSIPERQAMELKTALPAVKLEYPVWGWDSSPAMKTR